MRRGQSADGGFGRLRWQLTGWYTIVTILILTAFVAAVYGLTLRNLLAQEDTELRSIAMSLLSTELLNGETGAAFPLGQWGVITDAKGRNVLAIAPHTPTDLLPDRSLVKKSVKKEHGLFSSIDFRHEPIRIYTLPVMEADRVLKVIQLARPTTTVREQGYRLLRILLYSGIAIIALTAIGGWLLADRSLRPIRRSYQRQRQFVADASHELRTPLAILASAAEVLERRRSDTKSTATAAEPILDPIEIIATEVVRMGELVKDLLTLANTDNGQIQLQRVPLKLNEVVRRASAKANLLAQGKNLEFIVDLAPGNLTVSGDAQRLEEMLLILLDNAVKFTDQGQIWLQLAHNGQEAVISVRDTGPGIPAAELPHIFERFYRVDKARSNADRAFGLGLSIAHWIATSHGGTISAQSHLGEGTKIIVTLPLL